MRLLVDAVLVRVRLCVGSSVVVSDSEVVVLGVLVVLGVVELVVGVAGPGSTVGLEAVLVGVAVGDSEATSWAPQAASSSAAVAAETVAAARVRRVVIRMSVLRAAGQGRCGPDRSRSRHRGRWTRSDESGYRQSG